ncbi:TPA: hypothetical protein ACQSOC_006246, partial [Pseudomonas aeruginosa]
ACGWLSAQRPAGTADCRERLD